MNVSRNALLICWTIVVLAPAALGADYEWVPIDATGNHTINGNLITLIGELDSHECFGGPTPGATCTTDAECAGGFCRYGVTLELRMSGWDADLNGDPTLATYQATVDGTSYSSGAGAPLGPVGGCCPGNSISAFVNTLHPEFVFANLPPGSMAIPAVNIITLNYQMGATVLGGGTVADDGGNYYGGTVVLEIPEGALGTYTFSFINADSSTFMRDGLGFPITPIFTTPAQIAIACQTNEDCDDGNECTDDVCNPDNTCSNDLNYDDAVFCCDPATGALTPLEDGNECTEGICNPDDGTVTQQPLPDGTTCGNPPAGECDAQDTCDGAGTCVDRLAADGTPCGDPGDTECDDPDTCDGTGVCRANPEPPGTACGDPTDTDCNGADSCDGNGVCLDNIQPPGAACGDPTDTECDDPDTCDGAGTCLTNEEPAGLPCGNPVGSQCDDPDTCDGAGVCQTNPVPAGAACGNPGSSECDNPDACDGAGSCNANNLPNGTPCTDDGNECRDDVCQAGVCSHPLEPAGTPCGDPTDTDCDNPDSCDGTGACQDNLEPSGAACGDPTDTDCDGADSCDGNGTCLANIEPSGTACGDPTDTDCDDPDTCDGAGTCLANVAPSGLPCGNQVGNNCDNPDTCDGAGVCDTNFVPAGTPCGNPTDTECDNPDSCNGMGVCTNNNEPNGTACTDDGNECRDDICQSGVCSHPLEPAGTPCGDPTDTECDNPNSCDGTGTCLSNLEPVGTGCGDPSDTACTNPDTCNGFGTCLPNHEPDGTDCDDGSFCNAGATCLDGECGSGTAIDCDDGLLCTDDWCNEAEQRCENDLLPGFCLIDAACYDDQQLNPDNDCEICDPALATETWSFMPEGTPCDDGDPCTGTGEPGIGFDECTLDGVCFGVVDPNCNDDCINAVEVFDGANIGNNEGRGPDDDEASCQPDSNNDVWYFYVSSCTGPVGMDTDGSVFAPFNDTVLSVYDDCGGTEIACDDDGGLGLLSALAFNAIDGETYYIRVAGFEEDAGDIVLNIYTLDGCVIDGTCYSNGQVNPDNECEACIPLLASTTWSPRAAGSPCGDPGEDECDSPDSCNGLGLCEPNHKEDFEPCDDDGNDCTIDICAGGLCTHPPEPVGTACGDQSTDECDYPDTCDGAGICMPNYASAGLACGDPSTSDCDNADICDGAGSCSPNHQPDGTLCTDDGNECSQDVCSVGLCVHPPESAGTPCGDGSNTQCDNPDTCDGTGICLPNYEAPGFACGDPTDTECDNPDTCNGAGGCVDNFEPIGFTCGDPTDTDCDNPDTCDGAGACLVNFEINGFPCGDPNNTQCDNPDTCNGAGMCLDNFEPAGLACGDPSTSDCDNADTCDGVGICAPNHQPDGLACTDDGNECTFDECSTGECIHPPRLAGTPCGDGANTQCDNPDTCDGTGICLDNFEDAGFACGDPTDTDCDNPDTCDGGGVCLDNLEPVGFACGDPTDNDCNNPDTCDGAGVCLDNFEIEGFPCGDPTNTQCDNPDTCDGVGTCLDNFEPLGLPCGDPSEDQCDNPDICDGAGLCDPNYKPAGTPCDDEDICTGDDDCFEGLCAGTPIATAPLVERVGPKAIAVTPLPAGDVPPVALRVTSPDWPCLDKYVGPFHECGNTGTRCKADADCNYCNNPYRLPCLTDQDCKTCTDPLQVPCDSDADCPPGGYTCVQVDTCVISGNTCDLQPLKTVNVNDDGELVDVVAATLVDDPADALILTPDDWSTRFMRCSISFAPCSVDGDCDAGTCNVSDRKCSVAAQDCFKVCAITEAECETDDDCSGGPGDTCTVTQTCELAETCDFGKIHLTGDDFVPSGIDGGMSRYEVVAECGEFISPAGSAETCLWGDINCDGVVNFTDIQVTILAFEGDYSPGVPFTAMDIQPCMPEQVLNFTDIQFVVLAFEGMTYEQAGCPVPCP